MVYIVVKDELHNKEDKMTLISHVSKNYTRIIDSGYSHHMTGDKTKLEHMEYYDGGSVRFGNNEPCNIKGRGCISLTNEIVYIVVKDESNDEGEKMVLSLMLSKMIYGLFIVVFIII